MKTRKVQIKTNAKSSEDWCWVLRLRRGLTTDTVEQETFLGTVDTEQIGQDEDQKGADQDTPSPQKSGVGCWDWDEVLRPTLLSRRHYSGLLTHHQRLHPSSQCSSTQLMSWSMWDCLTTRPVCVSVISLNWFVRHSERCCRKQREALSSTIIFSLRRVHQNVNSASAVSQCSIYY